MRAITKPGRSPGLEYRTDLPVPSFGPDEVLIRVLRSGVCGTDLHIYEWDSWAQGRLNPPLIVGHEFVGRIEKKGDRVGDWAIGELVSAEGHIVCGHCFQCRTGQGHICKETRIIGVDRDGCWADFIVMPASNLWRVPNGVSLDAASIFDPMGNAFHTALATDLAGKSVLVVGCGPIGLFAVGIARASGATRVLAMDVNDQRLAMARTMGADVLINPKNEDPVARAHAETDGLGVDVVLEMSGNATAIGQAFKAARMGAFVSMLGIPSGEVTMKLGEDVIFKGLTLQGIIGRKMYDTWFKMTAYLKSGRFDPAPVITHHVAMTDFDEAFRAMKSGEAGKVVLMISED